MTAGALAGCEDTPPPKTPQHTAAAMTAMPGQLPPSQGGPQFVAPPEPPAAEQPGAAAQVASPQMNAQALAYYNQGVAAFGNADLAGAAQAFTAATSADPRAYKAFYSLGVIQERLGNGSAASSAYQQSFSIQPEFVNGMIAYAALQANGGDKAGADSFLTQRRSAVGKNRDAQAKLAAALAEVKSQEGDSASAQQIAQEALKIEPSCSAAMMVIARDHWRGRRLDLALYALKAILDGFGDANPPRDKNNAEGFLLRATILLEQDKRVPAMDAFKKAMELRPDLIVARLRVATYLLESGDAAEAIPVLQKTLQYDHENVGAHLSLGDAYRLTGDFSKAKEEFDWVRSKDNNMAQVYYNMGLLYLFAPNAKMGGMSELAQNEAATAALNKFKDLVPKGQEGDVDELLKRASIKESELKALAQASAQAAAPPPPPPASATASATASAEAAPPPSASATSAPALNFGN